MRELRIGDRVRTPVGDGVIVTVPIPVELGVWARSVRIGDGFSTVRVDDIEPLPPDIPRERVADLHAAVTKRLEQLDASRRATHFASERDIYTACHSDLSEVAEALRLMLEVDDGE